MTKRYLVPLTAGDLREIAKLIDRTEKLLFNVKTGEFRADGFSGAMTGIWSIPVLRPDTVWGGKDSQLVGHLVPEDGWLGFVPLGEIDE